MRKIALAFISFALSCTLSLSAFASVSTPSNASRSNALRDISSIDVKDYDYRMWLSPEYTEDIMRFSFASESGIETYSASDIVQYDNTVDLTGVYLELQYYDSTGARRTYVSQCNSEGDAIITRDKVPMYSSTYYYRWIVTPRALPKTGNWRMQVYYTSDVAITFSRIRLAMTHLNENATTDYNQQVDISFNQSYGSFSFDVPIKIDSTVSNLYINTFGDFINPPYGGRISIRFSRTDDTPIATPAPVDPDVQQQVNSENIQNISNTANGIYDTLHELIQHISNQLAALWDQMYNLMHLRQLANDDKNTQAIIDTLQNGLSVSVEEDRDNFEALMENDDANTNYLANGYDTSQMDSNTNNLSNSLNGYDQAEQVIFDQVHDSIDNFEYQQISSNPSAVLTALGFFGTYMQRIFDSMSFFNRPITLALTLTYALMLIGYQRFRN